MDKFLDNEIIFLKVISVDGCNRENLAGGVYINHENEITNMIDKVNGYNVSGYRKASFWLINN